MPLEDRTARLTVLIDPRKKALLERICAEQDTTPSQVVRQLIRRYIEDQTGTAWTPAELDAFERPRKRRR
ncbi:MAG: CopG family transcriptional regulator [Steroidobacteraceae bacterium]|nr:CopG family transcriptional regulator [Pseudomonadota bacterium]MBP7609690.1 CopG family transcriptional regulator [Steroidobacteraceae bacterium]MBP7609969.1 CopG family transcriptional regulator [Steroidobacteraceae bacterium]MBP9130554.1 CopG family transcriptional regulator [Steroidobacteraceae bacterium]